MPNDSFKVNLVPTENGSYTVQPEVPEYGKISAGSKLLVTAQPNEGYALDAVYYTVQGGMWGVTHYESFVPEMEITIDTNT